MNFFRDIVSKNLIEEWAELLDWFFDDYKFEDKSIWTRSKVTKFTNRVKKILEKNNIEFRHFKIKDLEKPSNSYKKYYIYITGDNSKGKELVRHIRNGIAHGKVKTLKNKNTLCIKIEDNNNNSKKNTAYLYFPIFIIGEIYKIYKETRKEK